MTGRRDAQAAKQIRDLEKQDRVLGCMMRVLTHTAAAVLGMLAGILFCI